MIDVDKFRRYKGSPLIVSLMMMANDIERLAYLRILHTKITINELEYFEQYIGAYTMCLLCSHVYEALELIKNIKADKQIGVFIEQNDLIFPLYKKVARYNKQTIRQTLYEIRNMIAFHYKWNALKLKTSMDDLVTAGFHTDRLLIGELPDILPTSHEFAMNATDAMFLRIIGGVYTGKGPDECHDGLPCTASLKCNHSIAAQFIHEVEELQKDVRFFADALIKVQVSYINGLSNWDIGFQAIDWKK